MQDFLAKILNDFGIEFYGFCKFKSLENCLINCAAKRRLPPLSKTVITFLFPYNVSDKKPKNISRYSAVKDYHLVCGEILKNIAQKLKQNYPNFTFEPFIDNSPINEVLAAALSGLGVRGKNRLLINQKYGSYCFIGEIVTDYEINTQNKEVTECINCAKCVTACPSGALKNSSNKCLSAITQQKKELSEAEIKLIKNSGTVWGCDACQECCPMNKNISLTKNLEFIKSYRAEYKKNEDINLRAYAWRGEQVILRNYELINKE